MYKQVEKSKENKSSVVANSVTQKESNVKQGFGFVDNRPEAVAQRKMQNMANNSPRVSPLNVLDNNHFLEELSIQNKENDTGLPDNLKTGIENLSGYSINDVKVHYKSDKPAQLQAHAYAQGTDIHLSSGQEKHLPHEAWHVVQQKQRRVEPTMQMKGKVNINDAAGLEKEADAMGDKAAKNRDEMAGVGQLKSCSSSSIVQRGKYSNKEKKRLLEKLRRSRKRNLSRKARPKRYRKFYKHQRKHNYGYERKRIFKYEKSSSSDSRALVPLDPNLNRSIKPQYEQFNFSGMGGYFRMGFGGQPFLYLNKDLYEDNMIKSNYDEIIAHFKDNDSEIALQLLGMIEGEEEPGKDRKGQAKSLFAFLTQIVEPHSSRIPGADKLARGLLRRIALGQLNFRQAFNRKNGIFVSAWAKGGGATKGGQEAARTLFGAPKKKNDKYDLEELEKDLNPGKYDELFHTVDQYYSDSSDDEEYDSEDYEDREDSFIFQKSSVSSDRKVLLTINEALRVLGFSPLKGINQVGGMASNFKAIKRAYYKRVITAHPDKTGGSVDKFQSVTQAYKYLEQICNEYKKAGGVDSRGHAINQQLNSIGLILEEIDGDGNCFYAAILDQLHYLNNYMGSPAILRGIIAQLILDNQEAFQVFVTGETLNTIVNQILTSRNWDNQGGDFAPQLIATVLQRNVRIVAPTGVTIITPRGDLTLNAGNTLITGGGTITIVYNGNNHYNSTRMKSLK